MGMKKGQGLHVDILTESVEANVSIYMYVNIYIYIYCSSGFAGNSYIMIYMPMGQNPVPQ